MQNSSFLQFQTWAWVDLPIDDATFDTKPVITMDWRGDVISLVDDLIAGYEHQFLLVDYDTAMLTAVSEKSKKENDDKDTSEEKENDDKDASEKSESDAKDVSEENENDAKEVSKKNNDENDIEKETDDKQALEIDADEDNVEKILKLLNYIADWKKLKVKREPEEVKVLANKSEDHVNSEAKIDSKDPINAKQEEIEYLIEIKSEALDEIKREDSAVARLAAAEADARATDANTKERDANKLRKGVYAYKELNAYKKLTYKKLAAHTFEVSPDLTESTVPGLYLWGFLTPPVAGADLRAALVANCFLGALPPVPRAFSETFGGRDAIQGALKMVN